jgi:hypothetical protein
MVMPKGSKHSEETKKKMSSHIPWNKNKRGLQIGWSKGLTKETSTIIRKSAKKQSKTMKRLYAEGKIIPSKLGQKLGPIKKCLCCEKEFYCYPSLNGKRKYCSRICAYKELTGKLKWDGQRLEINNWLNKWQFEKGHIPINKGKKVWGSEGLWNKPHPSLNNLRPDACIRMKNSNPMTNIDTRNKMANSRRGQKFPKLSEARRELLKKRPELMTNLLKRKIIMPNKQEQKLNEILQSNFPGEFNYVGDGKVWFEGENHIFNPDFLSTNPKHIIELFGDYWHRNTEIKDKERLETYASLGYKTLVIWEHELKNKEKVIAKIRSFL